MCETYINIQDNTNLLVSSICWSPTNQLTVELGFELTWQKSLVSYPIFCEITGGLAITTGGTKKSISTVTTCYYMLLHVTTCYYMLLRVTTCYYALLRVTTRRYALLRVTTWHCVTLRVTTWYFVLLRGTTWYYVILRVSTC